MIFVGFDHYNQIPLYQVYGPDYIGEWHRHLSDAQLEDYEMEVRQLEAEGLTRSDAQSVIDARLLQEAK